MSDGCPKCGATVAADAAECPSCGVVIAKAVARSRTPISVSKPVKAPPPAVPLVAPDTLQSLQSTSFWVHALAFCFMLAAALAVVAVVALLFLPAETEGQSHKPLYLLGFGVFYLVWAAGFGILGSRLATFATALSPRGRKLEISDLEKVAEIHLKVWQVSLWFFLVQLLVILILVAAGFFDAG